MWTRFPRELITFLSLSPGQLCHEKSKTGLGTKAQCSEPAKWEGHFWIPQGQDGNPTVKAKKHSEYSPSYTQEDFPGGSAVKNPPANAATRDVGSIP